LLGTKRIQLLSSEGDFLVSSFPTNLDDFLRQNPSILTQTKKAEVTAAGPVRQSQVEARAAGYRDAGARSADINRPQMTIDEILAQALDPNLPGYVEGQSNFFDDRTVTRTTEEALKDSAIGAAGGFVQGIGGIGALGAGLVNDDAGIAASDILNDANEFTRSLQSENLARRNRAFGARVEALTDENRREAAQEGDVLSGLRRIGRDALDVVSEASSDPVIFSSGLSDAVGSLFAGGAVGKGLRIAGQAATKGAVGAGLVDVGSTAAGRVYGIAGKAAMPVAIGALEGGGVYQQTVQEALAMGATPEEANQAGLMAAAIQAPIGALSGALVSKFEANPLAVSGSGRSIINNILREALEEGVQGGTGEVASNTALRREIDPDREILDGVGEQVGLGMLYGAGAGGAVQTAGLGAAAAVLPVAAIKATAGAASRAIATRLENIQRENEAASPIADTTVRRAIDEQIGVIPEVRDGLKEAVAQSEATAEAKNQSFEYLDNLFNAAQFDPAPYQDESIPEVVRESLGQATDKFDAIQRLSDIITGETETGDKMAAAITLHEILDQNRNLTTTQFVEALEMIPDDHPLVPRMREFESVLISLGNTPKVRAAIKIVEELITEQAEARGEVQEIDPASTEVPTPDQVSQALLEAEIAPDKADKNLNDQVSFHALAGNISVTPRQMAQLKASASLLKGVDAAARASRQVDLREQDFVTREITISKREREQGLKGISALEHMRAVTRAVQSNDVEGATERLNAFGKFTQHLQNKLGAINASLADRGRPVDFQAFDRNGKPFNSRSPHVHLRNSASIRLAQQIAIEANTLGTIYNQMVESFPELGQTPVELVSLDDAINRPAQDVVDFFTATREVAEIPEAAETAQPEGGDQSTETEGKVEVQDQVDDREVNTNEVVDQETSNDVTQKDDNSDVEIAPEDSAETDKAEPEIESQEEKTGPEKSTGSEPSVATGSVGTGSDVQLSEFETIFPNLIGQKIEGLKSWFKESFKLPANDRSRILRVSSPLETIRDAFGSMGRLSNLMGRELRNTVNMDVLNAYSDYIELAQPIIDKLNANLEKFLNDKFQGSTFREQILAGNNLVLTLPRAKAANLLVLNEDGTLGYEQKLLESAVLAALQWTLVADNYTSSITPEDAAKILGTDANLVSENQIEVLSQGLSLVEAKDSLSKTLHRYWGLTPNRKAPLGYVDGITHSLAAELLRALSETQIPGSETTLFQVIEPELNTVKTPKRYIPLKLDRQHEVQKLMLQNPTVIEDAVLVEPEHPDYIGEVPPRISETQLRSDVPLKDEQKKALKAAQETPNFINPLMVNFFTGLGREGAIALFAHGDLENRKYNKQHKISLDGKNRTISAAYEKLMDTVTKVEAYADANSIELEEAPIYYTYEFSRVNRMQMQGPHNPQASKLAREAILPTVSVLDLTKRDSQDFTWFGMALAQALGVKIHQKSIEQSLNEVFELLDNRLPRTTEILSTWLQNGSSALRGLEAAEIETIRNELGRGGPVPVVALHATLEYLRYKNNPQDRNNFTTSLYIEADGVTNGPANAMAFLTSGEFTAEWIDGMKKVGMYLDGTPSMNEFRNQKNSIDLYKTASNALQAMLNAERNNTDENSVGARQLNAILDLMIGLGMDISENQDGDLEIDRGVSKNPLTITIYGSGARGIAGNLTKALLDTLYERFSEAAEAKAKDPQLSNEMALFGQLGDPALAKQQMDRFAEAIDYLTTENLIRFQGQLMLRKTKRKNDPDRGTTFDELTYDNIDFGSIQQNMLMVFVEPLISSIRETTAGNMLENANLLRQTTQVQSIFRQFDFINEIRALVDQKKKTDPNWKPSDFFSQEELDLIRRQLRDKNPLIETDSQNIEVSGNDVFRLNVLQDGSESEVQFGHAFDETMRSPGNIRVPSDAGVAGIPLSVISMGDGKMMQHLLSKIGAPEGGLGVFDGFHMKLSSVADDSQKVNQSAWTAWQSNPLEAAYQSFSSFLGSISWDNMGEAQQLALTKALFGLQATLEDATVEDLKDKVSELNKQLLVASDEIRNRQKVLSEVRMIVDQMASVGITHVTEGTDLSGMDSEQIADYLNQQLLAPSTESSVKADELIETVGRVSSVGARVLGVTALRRLYAKRDKLPSNQAEMLGAILRTLSVKDYKVVYGSQEELDAYAKKNGLRGFTPQKDTRGATVYADSTIYLLDPSTETLIHELVHAATFEKVFAYYNGGQLLKEETEAVARIEELMVEWLNSEEAALENQAYRIAHATVSQHYRAGDMAQAVNEFMAWSLANEEISQKLSETKTKTGLAQIAQKVLKAIKNLIFGRKHVAIPGEDMLSNLRFNTRILMQNQPSAVTEFGDTVSFQSSQYGSNDRLVNINQTLLNKFGRFVVERNPNLEPKRQVAQEKQRQLAIKAATNKATLVTNLFNANGFQMSMQEKSTFEILVSLLGSAIESDASALARLQEYFSHVEKLLKVEDFLTDPNTQDPNQRVLAQMKFNVVMGNYGTQFDALDRSSLLPAFVALATVNDGFRSILAQMEPPKRERGIDRSLDTLIENFGTGTMESLAKAMANEKRPANVQVAIDTLVDQITRTAQDRKTFIDRAMAPGGNALDKANDWVIQGVEWASDKTVAKTTEIIDKSNNKLVTAAAKITRAAASIISEKNADTLAEGSLAAINRSGMPNAINELLVDIVGRVKSSSSVYDMIKAVRSMVQKTRQQFRDDLPPIIEKQFTRKLTEGEWTALYNGLGRTDLAALKMTGKLSHAQILELLSDPSKLRAKIESLENSVESQDQTNWSLLQRKSLELAQFMNTREVSSNLLRNAYAVASLYGEGIRGRGTPSNQLVGDLNQLITLYAVNGLDETTKNSLASLVQEQPEGVSFALAYLEGQRQDEVRKAANNGATINHYKGYIPSEGSGNMTLIVADDTRYAELISKSYIRVGDYEGSSAERGAPSMGYYVVSAQARAQFMQGIAQNVRATAAGVDLVSGFTYGMMTAGRITDPVEVRRIQRLTPREQGKEKLLPVYDSKGNVTAYERSVDPTQLVRLDSSTNLAQMLGVWHGRQVEETFAQSYNERLIDALHDTWKEDMSTKQHRPTEYVDLFGKISDPVLRDAMALMTDETKAYAWDKFGGQFLVRKDMLNDVLGYRSASIGDVFNGTSRLSDGTRKAIKDMAVATFGNAAYKHLVNAERTIQNFVVDAKLIIVVKSVIVPMSNFAANIVQLISRGVPMADIVRKMPKKVAEVDAYVRGQVRLIEAEAELRAVENDPTKSRKLKSEIQSINDAHRRLSIWPLIEAGEFSSISDISISREELALSQGKLNEYIDKLVDKLPESVKTAGRYAWISRDTALFKGLQRSIEYGDFLGKAILYEDLITRKKESKEYALGRITEEFVNYDRLPGRFRGYLENMGLLWFWNFKIRTAKIALNMIRYNPVHALMGQVIPLPDILGTVGSPIEDNLFMANLGYSTGPGQGFRSFGLHPWVNLTS
jgi:hypothetical protein